MEQNEIENLYLMGMTHATLESAAGDDSEDAFGLDEPEDDFDDDDDYWEYPEDEDDDEDYDDYEDDLDDWDDE